MISISYQSIFFILLVTIILVSILLSYIHNGKIKLLTQSKNSISDAYILNLTDYKNEKSDHENLKSKFNELNLIYSKLQTQYDLYQSQYQELIKNEENQLRVFENIANRVVQRQADMIDEKQKTGIKEVLEPFKEKIKSFEDKIDKNNLETVQRNEALKTQIRFLYDKSEQVSKDANNLAKALKGDYKKQGNWGELILESILDKSGLVKDREYFLQSSSQNVDGKLQKPDVVIFLPDEKKLIIDSKVSLIAYESMINSEDEEDQKLAQKAHSTAVKNHIDILSQKNYQDLYKMQSPDFVLMFIPIDTAFSAAIQFNPDIYSYAFDRNIVIVTSSTLLATLKTIESMWRNDKQHRNAIEIADEAGKMYDKFVGFTEDMIKLGKQMNTSQNTYIDSMRKLQTGTGSLTNRAENLKTLGAKTSKNLLKDSNGFTESNN